MGARVLHGEGARGFCASEGARGFLGEGARGFHGQRPGKGGVLAAAVGLVLLGAAPLPAAFYRGVAAFDARGLERALERRSSDGYRFEAFIEGAPHLAALASCEGKDCRDDGTWTYRTLDGSSTADLNLVLGQGYRFRAATVFGGRALFLFERARGTSPPPVEMRWLELNYPLLDLDAVAAAREAGYRIVAAEVPRQERVLLLLARAPGERGEPREVRRLADHPAPLVGALDRAAAEGWSLDAMWSRRPQGNPFTVELNALISRPRAGRSARAPFLVVTDRYEVGRQGRLVGALEWNQRRALFFQELPGWEYDLEERDLAPGSAATPAALEEALDQALRQTPFDPVVEAWAEAKSDGGLRLLTVCEDERPRGEIDAEPASPTGRGRPGIVAAPPLELPKGAKALPEGGGEPGAAWTAWLAALERRDLAAAKALMSEDLARSFELSCRVATIREQPSERVQKKVLGEWLAALPKASAPRGGYVSGERARLRLAGRPADGAKNAALQLFEIDLVRTGNAWRLDAEEPTAVGLEKP